jgi:hypothetical protein
MHIADFERDADAILTATTRARYLEASGRWPTLPLPQIYERWPDLSSLDTYEQLLDVEADERVATGVQHLALELHLGGIVAHHDAQLADTERQLTVEWGGDAIPLRLARQMVNVEEERSLRHDLDTAIRESSAPLVKGRLSRLKLQRRRLERLGQYDLPTDDLGFWSLVRGVAVDEVSKLAAWLLEETSELYVDSLRDQLVHHRLDEGDTWGVDLEWLFRGQEYDRVFPDHLLMPSVTRAFWDLGIRLEDQAHLHLDLEDNQERVNRSFCAPIGVPDEIVAMLAPRGGVADYVGLLQTVGQAERHAYADRTQSIVYRRLGDPAVTEGYGLLFAGLLERPEWLTLRLEADATRDAIRLRAFERLYRLRRAAVTHLYEVELRSHDFDERGDEQSDAFAEEYVDRLAEALYVRPFREDYVNVTDDPFASAHHLRAALFGCQLGQFLTQEIDEEWFRSQRAGRFLVDRWREGQRYTAEELARFLGFGGLDPSLLVTELRAGLVG